MDEWPPRFLKNLSNSFKVIIFDNRGMGETSEGSERFTIDRFADDLAGLMDALDIERAHVLGWSMGADVALDPSESFHILFPGEWTASHPDFWKDFTDFVELSKEK